MTKVSAHVPVQPVVVHVGEEAYWVGSVSSSSPLTSKIGAVLALAGSVVYSQNRLTSAENEVMAHKPR